MTRYEYKVVPAPARGEKTKDVKTPEGRFARSVQAVLNEMAREGWEYQRAELLPSEERSGLTGSSTKWRNLLVFRRPLPDEMAEFEPELLAPPVAGPATADRRNEPAAPAPVPPRDTDRVADLTPHLRARSANTTNDPTDSDGGPRPQPPSSAPNEAPERPEEDPDGPSRS